MDDPLYISPTATAIEVVRELLASIGREELERLIDLAEAEEGSR